MAEDGAGGAHLSLAAVGNVVVEGGKVIDDGIHLARLQQGVGILDAGDGHDRGAGQVPQVVLRRGMLDSRDAAARQVFGPADHALQLGDGDCGGDGGGEPGEGDISEHDEYQGDEPSEMGLGRLVAIADGGDGHQCPVDGIPDAERIAAGEVRVAAALHEPDQVRHQDDQDAEPHKRELEAGRGEHAFQHAKGLREDAGVFLPHENLQAGTEIGVREIEPGFPVRRDGDGGDADVAGTFLHTVQQGLERGQERDLALDVHAPGDGLPEIHGETGDAAGAIRDDEGRDGLGQHAQGPGEGFAGASGVGVRCCVLCGRIRARRCAFCGKQRPRDQDGEGEEGQDDQYGKGSLTHHAACVPHGSEAHHTGSVPIMQSVPRAASGWWRRPPAGRKRE